MQAAEPFVLPGIRSLAVGDQWWRSARGAPVAQDKNRDVAVFLHPGSFHPGLRPRRRAVRANVHGRVRDILDAAGISHTILVVE